MNRPAHLRPSRWPAAIATGAEAALLLATLVLLAVALAGPPLAQLAHYHAFADQATRWNLPHAMDVLSNLPFAVVALAGGWALWRTAPGALSNMQRGMAWLFFAGLMLTAAGSAWYHLYPDDAGLVVDRGSMGVAFAGLLGLAACRVSERAGAALGLATLLLAPLAVQSWAQTGNLLPWAVLQGGGLLLLLGLMAARPAATALPVRWWLVLAAYGVAKALELGDHAIWHLSDSWVSGHTLKHLVAALAAWPVVMALGTRRRSGQNARQPQQPPHTGQ